MEKHPLHIKNPELQTSPGVERAVERKERRTKEKLPNDPGERIETYIERLENIFLNPDERLRKRHLEMFRDKIYAELIIKRENFPESYFELQKRIARERGQAVEEIPDDVREQMKTVAIEDQRASLDAWMDYLTSDDAVYPAWFKYFAWRNIIKLSQFDKERGEFKKRTDSTVAPFPDIYREPLAQIADIYEKVKVDNKNLKEPEIREAFSKKFPALYAELIQKSLVAQIEGREEIRGQWIKYTKGNQADAELLFQSLENKGTGWCTAGRSTAKAQVTSGDFYVYYTYDEDNAPTQPRIAIRMQGNQIGEVRGILPSQGLEPVMQEVLDEKLAGFGAEADIYRKKSRDMKMLTVMEHKQEHGEVFTRDELIILYEINAPIEGFGYQKDPRIAELRNARDKEADMLVVLNCTREQIAHSSLEINENTKAYLGKLEPGIFETLAQYNIEHVYTSFPEGNIRKESINIGGKTWQQLEQEMREKNINISDYALDMMKSNDFETLEEAEVGDYVRLHVRDLLPGNPTTDRIYARANELGLDLCPAEVGPHYRLKYLDQPLNEYSYIAMRQIPVRDGGPGVFHVYRYDVGLWLDSGWARPASTWTPGAELVFRLRKKPLKS